MTDACRCKSPPTRFQTYSLIFFFLATLGLVVPVALVAAPSAARSYVRLWNVVLGYEPNPFEMSRVNGCMPTADGKKTDQLRATGAAQ